MRLNPLLTDDEAVSPVIGVILMVAITVILAAVIGAFVLGIGGSQEQVPSASFSSDANPSGNAGSDASAPYSGFEDGGTTYADYDDADTFTIQHDGGEAIAWSELTIKVGGPTVTVSGTDYDLGQEIDPTDGGAGNDADLYFDSGGTTNPKSGDMTAGSSITIIEHKSGSFSDADLQLVSGQQVSVIWSSSSSDSSQVLSTSTI